MATAHFITHNAYLSGKPIRCWVYKIAGVGWFVGLYA